MTETTGTAMNDEVEIDLRELLGVMFQHFWVILLCAAVGAILAFSACKLFVTPQYKSSTSVYILNKSDNSTVTYSDVQLGTQLTKDYAKLIKSRTVLESVIEECELSFGYKELNERISVNTISDTRLIEISVLDEKPDRAQLIADAVRKKASERIVEVMAIQAVNVVDEANLPMSPVSPSVVKWTGAGLLFGAFLCVMLLTIQFLLDDTIKTSDDVEKYLGLSTLALIPEMEDADAKKKRGHGKGIKPAERKRTEQRRTETTKVEPRNMTDSTREIDLDREDTMKE